MTDPSEPPRRGFRLQMGPGCLVFLLLVLVYVGYRVSVSLLVSSAEDRIRDKGYPTTSEDLNKLFPLPSGSEEAVRLIQEALQVPLGSEENDLKFMDLLSQFCGKEPGQLFLKLSAVPGTKIPTTQYLEAFKVLSQTVTSRAEQGDAKGALEGMHLMICLSSHVTPVEAVHHLMAVAGVGVTCESVIGLLSRVRLNEADIVELQSSLSRLEETDLLRPVLLSLLCESMHERTMAGWGLQMSYWYYAQSRGDPSRDLPGWLKPVPVFLLANLTGLWDIAEARYLDGMDRLIDLSQDPYPRRLQEVEAIAGELDDLTGRLMARGRLHIPLGMPVVEARALAKVRSARLALEITRFYLAQGKLPDSLTDLGVDLQGFQDPFDGQALRYKVTADEYLLYSVGPNLIDDGANATCSPTPPYIVPDVVLGPIRSPGVTWRARSALECSGLPEL